MKYGTTRSRLPVCTDMGHYQSDRITREKDRPVIAAIDDPVHGGLDAALGTRAISIYGVVPIMTVLPTARALSATRAHRIC